MQKYLCERGFKTTRLECENKALDQIQCKQELIILTDKYWKYGSHRANLLCH